MAKQDNKQSLNISYNNDENIIEIGVDEVGRGPLFGRVYTAAVILPKENFKFELFNFTQEQDLSKINETIYGNYLILTNSQNKIKNQNNQLIMDKFPFKINEIVEKINIALLKQKYNKQSKVWIGQYKLDVNSREIFKKDKKLKLTEREVEIILFLKNSKKSQSIENLQKEVWSHNSKLETHTVETHIYRLRKKN